jgi:hypothetical protein
VRRILHTHTHTRTRVSAAGGWHGQLNLAMPQAGLWGCLPPCLHTAAQALLEVTPPQGQEHHESEQAGYTSSTLPHTHAHTHAHAGRTRRCSGQAGVSKQPPGKGCIHTHTHTHARAHKTTTDGSHLRIAHWLWDTHEPYHHLHTHTHAVTASRLPG